MKHTFTLPSLLLLHFFHLSAQSIPSPTAVVGSTSLTFVASTVTNAASVVYNPNHNLYYTSRSGSSAFPLETFSDTGTPLFQSTTGLDTRGMWWNSNTNQMERNLFSSLGWGVIDLNASNYAIATTTTIFTGQNQPNVQSVGAYDPFLNQVIFYNGGNTLHLYDRGTGLSAGTLTLTGASFTNMNTNSVIYTGQTNYEIGLLDNVAKKIVFFDRSSGAFTAETLLPSTAVTANTFRFSYANNLVWLFNSTNKTWNSYEIFMQSPLPLTLYNFSVAYQPSEGVVALEWMNINNLVHHFVVERSEDGVNFAPLAIIPCQDVATPKYQYIDTELPKEQYFYRVRQVDADGLSYFSQIEQVQIPYKMDVDIYPSPTTDQLFVYMFRIMESFQITFYALDGKIIYQTTQEKQGEVFESINVQDWRPGIYYYKIVQDGLSASGKIVKE